jgi:hypothetical protein
MSVHSVLSAFLHGFDVSSNHCLPALPRPTLLPSAFSAVVESKQQQQQQLQQQQQQQQQQGPAAGNMAS